MLTRSKIAEIRGLASRKGRSESPFFPAEGEKLAGELLESSFETERIYYVEDTIAPELKSRILRSGKGEAVTAAQMERITLLKTPTPVLALIRKPHYTFDPATAGDELTLALDGVQDPGNLGTIIRLADWFGIRDIFCSPDSADLFNPKVIQATMGAIARVRVHYTALPALLAVMRQRNLPVYGTFLAGENIYRAELENRGAVVMGNEGKGVSEGCASLASRKLFIPPYPEGAPTSESLNVGVATAIICSEFRRR